MKGLNKKAQGDDCRESKVRGRDSRTKHHQGQVNSTRLNTSNQSSEIPISIERRPMTDRARRAWDQFWNEIIEESKKELAASGAISAAKVEVDNNGQSTIYF